jgi:hypothetical protein
VEKGSMGTAVDHGSVDPKGRDNSCRKVTGASATLLVVACLDTRKGSGLIFPHPDTADLSAGAGGVRLSPATGQGAVTSSLSETSAAGPGRVFSSC